MAVHVDGDVFGDIVEVVAPRALVDVVAQDDDGLAVSDGSIGRGERGEVCRGAAGGDRGGGDGEGRGDGAVLVSIVSCNRPFAGGAGGGQFGGIDVSVSIVITDIEEHIARIGGEGECKRLVFDDFRLVGSHSAAGDPRVDRNVEDIFGSEFLAIERRKIGYSIRFFISQGRSIVSNEVVTKMDIIYLINTDADEV